MMLGHSLSLSLEVEEERTHKTRGYHGDRKNVRYYTIMRWWRHERGNDHNYAYAYDQMPACPHPHETRDGDALADKLEKEEARAREHTSRVRESAHRIVDALHEKIMRGGIRRLHGQDQYEVFLWVMREPGINEDVPFLTESLERRLHASVDIQHAPQPAVREIRAKVAYIDTAYLMYAQLFATLPASVVLMAYFTMAVFPLQNVMSNGLFSLSFLVLVAVWITFCLPCIGIICCLGAGLCELARWLLSVAFIRVQLTLSRHGNEINMV